MKQRASIIIYSIILSCLFAEDQIQKKAAPEDLSSKALLALISSLHVVDNVIAPHQAFIEKKGSRQTIDSSQVKNILPQRAWWGDSITIDGQNFSNIAKENLVHFDQVSIITNSSNNFRITVTIPEGARSCYPTVTRSGLASSSVAPLKIIAKSITFPYIRSIVEDRDNHYVYVGYDNSGKPKIAKVDLYRSIIPDPELVDGDPNSTIRPYLSRMITEGINKGEICYIRDYTKNKKKMPAVFCIKQGMKSPARVADLNDSNFDQPLLHPVAFDTTSDGEHFFVADQDSRHIIHVKRKNPELIDSDWGNRGSDGFEFFVDHRRTGLAVYNDYYYGPAVMVSAMPADQNPNDICSKNIGGSCLWVVTHDNSYKYKHVSDKILDIEVDRKISRKSPDETKNYFYLMTGAATLASDPMHNNKGFVESTSTPPSPIWDNLMLNSNMNSF